MIDVRRTGGRGTPGRGASSTLAGCGSRTSQHQGDHVPVVSKGTYGLLKR